MFFSEMMMQPHSKHTRQTQHGTWRTGYAFEFIEKDGKIVYMYKEGGNPGVDAIFSYFPQQDISLNILSNQSGPLWEMFSEIRDVLCAAGT